MARLGNHRIAMTALNRFVRLSIAEQGLLLLNWNTESSRSLSSQILTLRMAYANVSNGWFTAGLHSGSDVEKPDVCLDHNA